jgi:alkylhydroperoxidase family enzyme
VDPKFETKLHDLERRLLHQPGALDTEIRQAAAAGQDVPDAVAGYVDKVRRHAYEVADHDIEQLREAGYSEDQIFELTIAAAYGAARLRLDRAMDAMAALSSSAEASRERGGS